MNRLPFLLIILLVIAGAAFVLDLGTGTVSIPPDQVLAILSGHGSEKQSWQTIIMVFRLPKTIAACTAVAAAWWKGWDWGEI